MTLAQCVSCRHSRELLIFVFICGLVLCDLRLYMASVSPLSTAATDDQVLALTMGVMSDVPADGNNVMVTTTTNATTTATRKKNKRLIMKHAKATRTTTKKNQSRPVIVPLYPLKIQLPVFVASLFKSGTTSAHRYFRCNKQRAVHTGYKKGWIGQCLNEKLNVGTSFLPWTHVPVDHMCVIVVVIRSQQLFGLDE
jgi:hypothetical protein